MLSSPSSHRSASTHCYAEVNGVKLHYVEQGTGALILFLHGFPEFWYEWRDLIPEFASDYHAVAPDMRGYNLSDQPERVEAYQVPVIVEDVHALAVSLSAHRFVLVGHDWGGVIAWAYASAHPEMLDKLIIVNAPHPVIFARELAGNPAQRQASAYFNLFQSPQAEAFLAQNDFALLQGLIRPWAPPAVIEEYLACWRRGLTGALNYYRAAQLHSPVAEGLPQMNTIATPTLVIWGEKDIALLTGNLDGLDRYVTDLTVRRVPDGTHWVIHEKTAEVIRYMREFLGSPG